MQKLFLIVALLLTTGAFQNFWYSSAESMSEAVKGGDAELQWMWLSVDILVSVVCLFYWKEIVGAAREHIPMLLFVIWGALSISWSLDPSLSVRRIVALICTSALGFYLGIKYDLSTLMKMIGIVFLIAIIGSFVTALFLPSHGLMGFEMAGAWRGIFVHKNTMARVMALAALTLLCMALEFRSNRWLYCSGFAGALMLIALSHSATSLIVFVLALAVGFWSQLRLRPFGAIAGAAVLVLAALAASLLLEGRSKDVLAFLGKDNTLSGRTLLWSYSFDAVMHRPILGSGWDVFWTTTEADRIRLLIGWDAPHAHNAFLDFLLNVGFVGLLLFLAGLLDGIRKALRFAHLVKRPVARLPLLFYSFIFFYMFTETMVVDRHAIFQILFCALPVVMKKELDNALLPPELIWNEHHEIPAKAFVLS